MDYVDERRVGASATRAGVGAPRAEREAAAIRRGEQYLRQRGYADEEGKAEFQLSRTEKTVDGGALTDDTAQRAVQPLGIVALVAFALFTTMMAVFGEIIVNAVPLAGLTIATVLGYQINREWRQGLKDLDSGDDEKVDAFMKDQNVIVDVNNAVWTVLRYAISVWDLSLGVIWLLFQLVVDLAIVVLKFLFGTPELRDIILNLMLIGLQLLRILTQAAAGLLMALSGSGTFGGQPQFGAGVDSGSAAEEDEFRPERNFLVAGGQLVIESVIVIVKVFGPFYLTYLEFWFNVFLKVIPVVLKAVMFLLELLDPDKPFGRLLFSLLTFNFSVLNYAANNCFTQKAHATLTCWQSAIQASAYNHVVKVVNKLVVGGSPLKKIKGCNPKNLNFKCENAPSNPFSGGIFSGFGAGACDVFECATDVEAILDDFADFGLDCTFWLDTDISTPFCFEQIRLYSVNASASLEATEIDTVASELCFVMHERILRQCTQPAPPFGFDFAAVADEVCVQDLSGAPEPFHKACACPFQNPLCDPTCCAQYAEHANGQVQAQLGARTCGEVRIQFSEFGIWCPLNATTELSDYTFAHVWCNLWRKVYDPLCVSDLLLIQDLNVAPSLPAYAADTCTRVVDQIGVCQDIDATIADLTTDLIRDSVDLEPEVLYKANREATFSQVPIVTIPQPGDSAVDILLRNAAKHSCFQLSVVLNSSNPRWLAQPWSINYDMVTVCDRVDAASLGAPSVQQAPDVQDRRRDENGVFIATNLEGVEPTRLVFAASVPNAAERACDFGIGQSEEELSDLQRCTGESQRSMNDNGKTMGDDGVGTLNGVVENAQRTVMVDYFSGLADPEPGDPDFDRKMRDMAVFDSVQNSPTDFETPHTDELDADARNEFRNPFLVDPPPPGSFDDRNPLAVTYPSAPGGRTILSAPGAPPVAPPAAPTPAETRRALARAKQKRKAKRGLELYAGNIAADIARRLEAIEADKAARAGERAYMEGVKDRLVEYLEHARENLPDYLNQVPPDVREARAMRGSSRRLLVFDESQLSAEITALLDRVHKMPTTLGSITDEAFDVFLAESALVRFQQISELTATIVLPKIYQVFYGDMGDSSDSNSSTSVEFTFGGGDGSSDPDCRNNLERPYQCCTADATPYECCIGLFFCFPLPARRFILDRVTAENVDEWRCRDFDSFSEEWTQALRALLDSAVVSLEAASGPARGIVRTVLGWLKYPKSGPPANLLPCHYYNYWYLTLGGLIAWIFKIIFSVQQIGAIVITALIFVNSEGDKTRNELAEDDSIFD